MDSPSTLLELGRRFKRIEDLHLDAIAGALADITPDELISLYERRRT